MAPGLRTSKRRKVEEPVVYDPVYRSPTPLSEAFNPRPSSSPITPDPHSTSYNHHEDALPERRRPSHDDAFDGEREEESSDGRGDGGHGHTYWREQRSRSRIRDMDVVEGRSDRDREDERDERELARERERDEALMDRSSVTPIERADDEKPRKPERLFYKEKMVLRGHKRGVAAVKFSPDGRWIASCSADATIRIWESATGKHVRTLEGHLAGISTIAWSPDSKTLASGSDDKSIRLWDVATGKPYPSPLLGHHNYVYSIAFSPKGNMLVSGSYDEAVFLWDVRSGRVMRKHPAHSDPVSGVDFIRDGTLIVSCASDGLIRVWDSSTGQCLRTLVHEDNPSVSSVRFSPNGKYVLAWTLDSCMRLWDYIEGRCVKTYQGHVNVKFSASGAFGTYGEGGKWAFAVSGSEDGAVCVWDVSDKNLLGRLEGHEGVVLGCDALGSLIVSVGIDKTVRIWGLEGDEEGAVENSEALVNGEVDEDVDVKMERMEEDADEAIGGEEDGHERLASPDHMDEDVREDEELGREVY